MRVGGATAEARVPPDAPTGHNHPNPPPSSLEKGLDSLHLHMCVCNSGIKPSELGLPDNSSRRKALPIYTSGLSN